MPTQGGGREAAETLGYTASRFQRFSTQISIHTYFKAETASLLITSVDCIRATTALTVRLLDVSKHYEINTRLMLCQLIWTALGFSPRPISRFWLSTGLETKRWKPFGVLAHFCF